MDEMRPVNKAPGEETLAKEAPGKKTPVEEARVEARAEEAVAEPPVEEPPVEEASVEEASVEEASVEKASVEKASVEKASVEEASVEKASVEKASVEEAPVEEAPVEEAPVDGAPAEEPPAKEMPVDGAHLAAQESPWRIMAEWAGLTRITDLVFLLWPVLWASWLASEGGLKWPRFLALLLAIALARSAAHVAYVSDAAVLKQIPRERRPLTILFIIGSLCFALPLGWAGMLVPVTLALFAGWFQLRRRSYLSDPLLVLALSTPAAAGWLVQDVMVTKAAGLLWLAILLWLAAAVIVNPVERHGANLAALAGQRAHLYSALLKMTALATLLLSGRQAHLGIFFYLGILTAFALTIYGFWFVRQSNRYRSAVMEAWWGTAVFCGIAFHFLCACQVAAKV